MAIPLDVISVCAMTRDLIYTLVTFQIPLLLIWSVGPSSSNCKIELLREMFSKPLSIAVSAVWVLVLLIFITSAIHLISYWFNNVCSVILKSWCPRSFLLHKLWKAILFILESSAIFPKRVLVPLCDTIFSVLMEMINHSR
jgi:hypothetical protein